MKCKLHYITWMKVNAWVKENMDAFGTWRQTATKDESHVTLFADLKIIPAQLLNI